MPICIECRYPVKTRYTTYSKADDRSLGKGVRLTQCPRCKRFADKYVEHDFVVLFIDLVLIKPQVYRHLLFNELKGNDGKFHVRIASRSCMQKRLAELVIAINHTPRHPTPPFRRLPHMGPHRKALTPAHIAAPPLKHTLLQ